MATPNHSGPDRVITPEAVAVSIDVAGIGSRMIASIIDTALQGAIGLAFGLSLARSGLDFPGAVGIVLLFLLLWGYYPLWEGLWSGRTPGKRAQRLRVILTDGQPVTLAPVLVRNLLRVVDFLPAWYALGAIVMFISPRSQRLGDLAAGTIVVRETRAPTPVVISPSEGVRAPSLDAARLTEREYGPVRAFLQRRDGLDPVARVTLASQLVKTLAPHLGSTLPSGYSDEELLEAIALSYRERFKAGG